MSPPVVWRRLGDWKSGSGRIAPISLVHTRFVPTSEIDGLPRAPVVIGRAVLGVDGWFMSAVLPLPLEPDPVVLNRRVPLELQRYRRHEPRLTWEDLLRQRGEILFRTACEWSFAHAPEEVLQCWNRAW